MAKSCETDKILYKNKMKRMRIGILTLPLHTNYGGILQAYALQTVLERMGHEVDVLSCPKTFPVLSLWEMIPRIVWRIMKKIFVDCQTTILKERKMRANYPFFSHFLHQFINENIHVRTLNSLRDIVESDYDAYIVGSDQVWRPKYFCRMWKSPMANAFLLFTKGWNVKRFVYAASFGTSTWEYSDVESAICREMASVFDAISVRERSGLQLCADNLKVKATHVLDPTMLLSREDYIKLFMRAGVSKSNGRLLVYILDDNIQKQHLISRIAKEKKLVPFSINSKIENVNLKFESSAQQPMEKWLRGFYDAEFVVTDSFHACVFSIIFGKAFIAIGNEGRGLDRFSSLLDTFGLKSNLLLDTSEYNSNRDYAIHKSCMETLVKLRKESMDFLLSMN